MSGWEDDFLRKEEEASPEGKMRSWSALVLVDSSEPNAQHPLLW